MLTLLQPLPLLVELLKHITPALPHPVKNKQLACYDALPDVCCLQEVHLAAEHIVPPPDAHLVLTRAVTDKCCLCGSCNGSLA